MEISAIESQFRKIEDILNSGLSSHERNINDLFQVNFVLMAAMQLFLNHPSHKDIQTQFDIWLEKNMPSCFTRINQKEPGNDNTSEPNSSVEN